MKAIVLLAICLVIVSLTEVDGSFAASAEYRLRADITRRYDDIRRNIVPRDGDAAVKVSLGMALIKILDFDEDKRTLTTAGWLKHSWTDVNLVWDPEDYDGISSLRLPSDQLWRPDIYLYTSVAAGSGQDTSVMAYVYSTGAVLFIPPAVNTITCDLIKPDDDADDDVDDDANGDDAGNGNGDDAGDDAGNGNGNGDGDHVHHHDVDDHDHSDDTPEWSCKFKYGSWVYDGNIVSLGLYENETEFELDNFNEDPHCEVVSTNAVVENKYYPCCSEPYPSATFEVRLKHRSK